MKSEDDLSVIVKSCEINSGRGLETRITKSHQIIERTFTNEYLAMFRDVTSFSDFVRYLEISKLSYINRILLSSMLLTQWRTQTIRLYPYSVMSWWLGRSRRLPEASRSKPRACSKALAECSTIYKATLSDRAGKHDSSCNEFSCYQTYYVFCA